MLIAVSIDKATYDVIRYNVIFNANKKEYELWITGSDFRSRKILESEDESEVMEIKLAIDKAVELCEKIVVF